jgi:hypothetical protein
VLQADGFTLVPVRRLPDLLEALPATLAPSGWPEWLTEPDCGSTPPPDSLHGQTLEHRWRASSARLLGALDRFEQRRLGVPLSSNDLRVDRRANGGASFVMAGV